MAKSPAEVWLWLLMVMQPFNSKTNYILSQCDYDAAKACRDICAGRFPFLSEEEKRRAVEVRNSAIHQVMNLCAENNVQIVTMDDDKYPKRLKCIEKPPIVLFAAGNLEGLDKQPVISVVGARAITDYSAAAAKYICEPLAKRGIAIVSGLAVGSDTAAHAACLNAGGRTIGVAACGILVNYPTESAGLKRAIVENGGAIISELLPTSKSFRGYFHERNRIISGLSMGTLVIQAAAGSGALLTAAHAKRQDRAVFCIPPHDILSHIYTGNMELIRSGALMVFGYSDITERLLSLCDNDEELELKIKEINKAVSEKVPTVRKTKASEKSKNQNKSEKEQKRSDEIEIPDSLSEDETELFRLICTEPCDNDSLMDKVDMDFGVLSEALTNLEICGYITRTPEGVYTTA